MKDLIRVLGCLLILTHISCSSAKNAAGDDGKIEISFLQINDVYEIAPLANGTEGGMARVAQIKKELLQKNENTFLVMAGDFLSPSVFNSVQHEGKRVRGKQMVDAMNVAGTDLAVLGNHEFDIAESELQSRINESQFTWVASNVLHKKGTDLSPFIKTSGNKSEALPKTLIKTVRDKDGTTAKIGFIGLTLPSNKAPYVHYNDALSTAKKLYNDLKDSVDVVIALTHQLMEEDETLAREIPGLTLIMGGHEHDQRYNKIGNVYITKAHANAKSAYVNTIKINKKKRKVKVDTDLKYINEKVGFDEATNAVVKKWMEVPEKNFGALGFDATKVVITKGEPLDGRESEVRRRPTNLTRLIVAAMAEAAPQAEVTIMNSGGIRVDDLLHPPVTQYDFLRALPFGNAIQEAEIKGSLLVKVLDQGRKNAGIGGYLLYSENVTYNESSDKWLLNNAPIDEGRVYRIATSEFLLTGGETNIEYLNPKNPEVTKIYPLETAPTSLKSDIRLAIVKYLEKRN